MEVLHPDDDDDDYDDYEENEHVSTKLFYIRIYSQDFPKFSSFRNLPRLVHTAVSYK